MSFIRKHTNRIVLCLITLIVVLSSLSSAFQKQTDKDKPIQSSDVPTLIQEGVISEKQKKHSKIYKGFDWFTNGKKINDLTLERGDVEINAPLMDPILRPTPPLNEFLQKLTCDADAVVRGIVMNKTSQLVESGTFIFTDYGISVQEVLKDNHGVPIRRGNDITVTRAGGAVKLNGHIARAIDPTMRPLEIGKTYLLYLKFLPETGAYRPFGSSLIEDTFRIQGETLSQVSGKLWPFGGRATGDTTPFLNEAHNALNSQCMK